MPPVDPEGPSVSPYKVTSERAPVCVAIARASFGLIELSGNTALTCSLVIRSTSRDTSCAEGCACVVWDGMTAPTIVMP